MERVRCACFTLNNYTETEYNALAALSTYDYLIMGREGGIAIPSAESPTSDAKTPHIQGYIEFTKRQSFNKLKKINTRIHWEPRYGTQKQAIEYCKKEGNFKEYGEARKQGERKDLKHYREVIKKEGKLRTILENEEEMPSLQTIKSCEKYLTYCEKKRDWKPEVIWISGESGCGKTRLAYEIAKNDDIYTKDETQWWDGYDAHETIIIDDFRGKQMNFTYLLKLLDRYEMRLQIKGGYRQCLAKKIIITSIHNPDKSYAFLNNEEPMKQLYRRITTFIDFNSWEKEDILKKWTGHKSG